MDFYENPEDYITLTMLGYTVSIVLATTFYTSIIFNLAETFKFLSGLEVLFSATLFSANLFGRAYFTNTQKEFWCPASGF